MSNTDAYIENTLRRIESRLNNIDLLTDRIDDCAAMTLDAETTNDAEVTE